ncbi:unnamed protein product [Calypogeia fissa]
MTVGHSSFSFYSLLSLVAMEEDIKSDLPVVLLGRTAESAVSSRQKARRSEDSWRLPQSLTQLWFTSYKYRAAALMDEQKVHLAIVEIPSVLGYKVTPDCSELELGRGTA